MKIEHVRITNFKKVTDFELNPGKVNIFLGPNGTGKSSILQALRYGLTGNSPQDPIGEGANKAAVEMIFPDIGTLTRSIISGRNEVKLNGKTTTQKSINELFFNQTGASAETAGLLTSAETLASLSSGDLSSYFLGNNLLSVGVPFDLLNSFCNLSDEGRKELWQEFGSRTIQMSDIDRVWNEAKARRKILKQEVKEAEIRSKNKNSEIKDSAEDVDKQLKLVLKKQAELQTMYKSYELIMQQRQKTLAEIEEKKGQLGTLISLPQESELERYDAEIDRIEKELGNLKGILATIHETGIRLSKILKDLETSTCPISSNLICTTDKSPIRAELNDSISKARGEYIKQRSRIAELEKKHSELKGQRKILDKRIAEYRNHELLQKQIQYLHQNLPEEPQRPSEQEIQQVSEQVEALTQKQTMIVQNLIAAEYSDLFKEKSEELSICEEIIRELDPRKGIRQKVLEHSLKPLEEYFNNELKRLLPGYQVKLDCSNGFFIRISNGKREFDAAKSASSGEQSRIWFVLMDLINALSPYRILIYDNTDSMDAPSLSRLLDMLASEDVQNRYDHIFISMIDYDEVVGKLENMPGISVIRMGISNCEQLAA